jgi:hypothetical protein
MAGAVTFAVVTGGGYRPAIARVEKASNSSDLRNERRHQAGGFTRDVRHVRNSALSQSETSPREPLWSGPELNAAFVAQLLGQALSAPMAVSAGAPYRKPAPGPVSLVYDALT